MDDPTAHNPCENKFRACVWKMECVLEAVWFVQWGKCASTCSIRSYSWWCEQLCESILWRWFRNGWKVHSFVDRMPKQSCYGTLMEQSLLKFSFELYVKRMHVDSSEWTTIRMNRVLFDVNVTDICFILCFMHTFLWRSQPDEMDWVHRVCATRSEHTQHRHQVLSLNAISSHCIKLFEFEIEMMVMR